MAILKRGSKNGREKDKPKVVTGSFELHYEDIVNRSRFGVVIAFVGGFLIVAAFTPTVVRHSLAGVDRVSIEAESGIIYNSHHVKRVGGDATASDNSYIEFLGIDQ